MASLVREAVEHYLGRTEEAPDLPFGDERAPLLVDIGAESGIIDKSGAWYSYGKERIGQGRENAKLYLKDHPDVQAEIEEKVKVVLGITEVEAEEDEVAAEVDVEKVEGAREAK